MGGPKEREYIGSVWLLCPYPVLTRGLSGVLSEIASVKTTEAIPEDDDLCCILLCATSAGETGERVRYVRSLSTGVPVVVFGLSSSLPVVRAALRAGARGFVHGEMGASQILRAISIASKGEVVVPRDLIRDIVAEDETEDLESLTPRQLEILRLVSEGMTNAQIGARLYLSESTVKQHLRSAFKTLRVSNRTEAARLVRGKI
ncbi:response regulator transcription factor [Rubrobacter indicoceani]|uniref:response regulator transcription factor n=1 Tax=Rubrobacter indicoceani TaxID=2051957 RepID=UPI0013C3FE35|nr:response regulator transcription factor [Rubrobacter indicoceani]